MEAIAPRWDLPRGRRGLALRLAWYLGVVLLITWPLARDPVGQVIGHAQASVGCHVWLIWWAGNHLADPVSPLIFHPHGADVVRLYGSDLLSPPLLGLLPLPPALAYNLWVVFLLIAGGMGVDRLARRLGLAPGGALVGGTIFATAPFFQHELFNGTSEMLAAAVLPWFAIALLDVLDGRWATTAPPKRALGPGISLGLLTGLGVAASAYNLFFLLVVGTCIVLARLAGRLSPVFGPGVKRSLATGVGVSALFGLPLAWVQLTHGAFSTSEQRAGLAQLGPNEAVLPDSFADLVAWVDMRDAVIPAILHQPGGGEFEYWTTCTVYLGLVAIGLAAVGFVRRRDVRVFAVVAVVGVLIASGPWLRVLGQPVSILGVHVALPVVALDALLPGFGVTALHAYRYAVVALLGVSVLAAASVRRPWWAVLVLADAWLLSPVPWPAATMAVTESPVLVTLAQAPEGAVFSVPVETDDLGDLGWMLVAQTVHGKPVQDGGIHRRADDGATALFREVPMVAGIGARGGSVYPGEVETRWGMEQLQEQGYGYVLAPADRSDSVAWISGALGPPAASDGRWVMWKIPGPGSGR